MDLEERIQAAVLKKEQQKPPPATQPVAQNQMQPMQIGTGTTLTTYYPGGTASQEEENQQQQQQQQVVQSQAQGIRPASGASMTLAEYKKRQTLSASPAPVSAPNPGLAPIRPTTPGTLVRPTAKITPSQPTGALPPGTRIMQPQRAIPAAVVAPLPTPAAVTQGSSVMKTSHNNYEIHSQHVLNNRAGQEIAERDKNSAKMLVILASGEQRLITFTLPRESCTVQDLLEQVGVPFDHNTTIQCVEHRGANVDFVVTVGFTVHESASELISRAEESLQMNRSQENPAPVAGAAANPNPATPSPSPAYAQASAAAEQAKREAASSASGNTSVGAVSSAGSTGSAPSEGRKLIDGFLAVCQLCGFTGVDHARCERCKRVFPEPPKRKSYMPKNSAASSPASTSSNEAVTAATTAAEKKRELAAARFSKQLAGVAYSSGVGVGARGRGPMAMRGGRARGGRRVAEVDPVVLLSSEDEADEGEGNSETGNVSSTLS